MRKPMPLVAGLGSGRLTQPHIDLQDAFFSAESGLVKTKEGNGRYEMNHNTLRPKKPRTPAQIASQKRAATASVRKRQILSSVKV